MRQFYAYTHAKPDGRIFYVGKGMNGRAWDFAPSRRFAWHRNLIQKYGKTIQVKTYPTTDEAEAFELERFLISELRLSGVKLANLTDGGEGVSGRKTSPAVKAALAKGRGKERYANLSDEAKAAILDGLARGRQKARAWRESPAGLAHLRAFTLAGVNARISTEPRVISCVECGKDVEARVMKTRFCGKVCCQKAYRRDRRGR